MDSNSRSNKNPRFDAILIHGYWLSQKGEEGKVGLSLRSRLAARAAALLYDKGRGTHNFVLTAGHIWGPGYPSVARLMADEMIQKYSVLKKHVIVADDAMDTFEEIEVFLNLAKENDWKYLGDIAANTHYRTIPNLYDRQGQKTTLLSILPIESIIREHDNPHTRALVQRLSRSKYELGFKLYELAKLTAYKIDPEYKVLGKIAKFERKQKGHFGLTSLLPNDEYKT